MSTKYIDDDPAAPVDRWFAHGETMGRLKNPGENKARYRAPTKPKPQAEGSVRRRGSVIPDGTRVGRVVVDKIARDLKAKDHCYVCTCDCGRVFKRRIHDLHRSMRAGLDVTCAQGQCKSWSSQNKAAIMIRKEFGQMSHKVPSADPDRVKNPMCYVCYNQPWTRLCSVTADDGRPVCGPNLKCRGCGGRYSEEPANDRSVLGSSGAMWENVG